MTRREIARQVAPLLISGKQNSKTIRQLAALLVDEGRTDEVELLVNDIAVEMEKLGHSEVEVVSAHKMSPATKKQVEALIKRLTDVKSVELNETIDQSLVGGLIATTPTLEIDLSIRNRLKVLASQ